MSSVLLFSHLILQDSEPHGSDGTFLKSTAVVGKSNRERAGPVWPRQPHSWGLSSHFSPGQSFPPRISGFLGETDMTLLYESTGREATGQGWVLLFSLPPKPGWPWKETSSIFSRMRFLTDVQILEVPWKCCCFSVHPSEFSGQILILSEFSGQNLATGRDKTQGTYHNTFGCICTADPMWPWLP